MHRSTVSGNEGFDVAFNEWHKDNGNGGCSGANWGYQGATIRELQLQSRLSNVVTTYMHTYGYTNISVGFSYPAPTVGFTPADAAWSLANYTTATF